MLYSAEPRSAFSTSVRHDLLKDFDFMKEVVTRKTFKSQDGRPKNRFLGREEGPSLSVPNDGFPHEMNVMAMQFFDKEQRKLKSVQEIRAVLLSLGVDLGKSTVALDGGPGVAAFNCFCCW